MHGRTGKKSYFCNVLDETLNLKPILMKSNYVKALLCALLTIAVSSKAQTRHPWEDYLDEVMMREDDGEAVGEEMYEWLCELEQHPMDINAASREQLEQLPFLTAQQVEDIMVYQYRYGPMKSLSELLMIPSLDNDRRQLLTYFIYIGREPEQPSLPPIKDMARYSRHELVAAAHIPFYQRKGDREGYLGYPYKHWLRYQLTYRDRVKLGLVASQDAGEPFFSNRNRWGYDYYSAYLQLKQIGRLASLVVGRYKVAMGMGMVMNSSFSMGKMASLQNLGRPTNLIRPHASRSEANYLQGAAASVNLTRHLSATAFASYRSMDATLNQDGQAATIVTSGYHRTENEMEKKNNLKNTTLGGSLRYTAGGFHLGANAVYTHLSRRLSPNTAILYRQHYPQGTDFLNVSTDYGYVSHRLALNGETALSGNGALATINSISLQMGGSLSILSLQRFYSYRYAALYASSFSDGGRVQNESGIYLGVNWQPMPSLKVMAYTDFAYAPWAKYQVSQSSRAWDHLLQLSYTRKHWTLGGRYRLRRRQRDNTDKTALIPRTEHRARLSLDYQQNGRWTSKTQLDYNYISSQEPEQGFMVSETLGYHWQWLRLNGGFGYFRTDGYDSRVYLYEQGPLYTYTMSQFQGKGVRGWLMVRAAVGQRLSLTAKFGVTKYLDRDVISSSYQQIDGSSQTDLDLQIRWKF